MSPADRRPTAGGAGGTRSGGGGEPLGAGAEPQGLPPVAVSTPGKLILMGEHAVVYGRPALVAAIDLRLRASFSSPPPAAPADVDIDLPGLPHRTAASWREIFAYARAARDAWTAYEATPRVESFLALRGSDPAHLVKVALGEVAAALGDGPESAPPPLCLRLDSDLPLGSGFGSSAAAAVAVVAGFAAWRAGGGGAAATAASSASSANIAGIANTAGIAGSLDLAAIERLALEAERRQHGLPSGVDTATSLHGGLLWARRRPQGGGLACEPLATSSPLLARLRVYHTGTPPESTGAVVAAVRARRDLDPAGQEALFDRMEAAALALRRQLEAEFPDAARVVALIRDHQSCLEALGVVPEPVRALVRQVEAAGGAAKISGAGSLAGPGAGSLLVYHEDADRAAGWDFLSPFPCYPVHLGATGCRREIP